MYKNQIPEGLRQYDARQAGSWIQTDTPNVLKPTAGSMGSLRAKFDIARIYSGKDSERMNKEVYKEVELCYIAADEFSDVPLRVGSQDGRIACELSEQQLHDLAPLRERFLQQKDSTDTMIFDWEALSDSEKVRLGKSGIWSVEQIFNLPAEQRFRLGPGADDLYQRAERHMVTKKENSPDEAKKELELLREQRERDARRMADLEAKMFELANLQETTKHVAREAIQKTKKLELKKKKAIVKEAIEKTGITLES